MTLAVQIVLNTPLWVWLVIAASLALGLRGMRDREGAVILYWLLPLLGLISISGQITGAAQGLIPLVYVAAYALFAVLGHRVQGRWIRWKAGGRVAVRGEWLTLTQVMTLCAIGYAEGVLSAIAPDVAGAAPFRLTTALAGAAASGLFLGRSLRILLTPSAPLAAQARSPGNMR